MFVDWSLVSTQVLWWCEHRGNSGGEPSEDGRNGGGRRRLHQHGENIAQGTKNPESRDKAGVCLVLQPGANAGIRQTLLKSSNEIKESQET